MLAILLLLVAHPAAAQPFVDVTSGPLGDTGNGQGVAWGDYDNDGDLDLCLANWDSASKLFRNDGGGMFVDATSGPLGDSGQGQGVAWGDYDNDGDLDLYLAKYGQANKLFRNDGGEVFVDATSGPLGDTGISFGVAWGDYNNDGDLDLYLANWDASKLFRNDGGGTFVDATSGPLGDTGIGVGVAWGDYDNDGDLDLYLANWSSLSKLFRNDGGGTFVDATSGPLGDTGISPGVAWGDYDNDGDLDLYVSNDEGHGKLFRNDGGGTFADATSGPLSLLLNSLGVAWGDYDNDGDMDLYVSNLDLPALFRNDGGGTFVDATSGPLSDSGAGQGVAWGDYDNDGDLDLFLTRGANKLFRNDQANGNHWLHVKLRGTVSNRDGIGARVRVVAGGVSRIEEVSGGSGYLSQNSLPAEFGLGASTTVDTVEVRWPSGIVQVVTSLAVDRTITVTEQGWTDVATGPLADGDTGLSAAWGDYDNDGDQDVYLGVHGTNKLLRNEGALAFTDMAIPVSMKSSPGVTFCSAWADYDDDGDLDLYFGNGSGDTNRLFRNDAGTFAEVTSGPLDNSGEHAQGVSWVDSDNDGDVDLFVANLYASNRLFRNDQGTFVNVASGPLAVAADTTWAGAWADYDLDGDMDVYLVNQGPNRLLRNDGENLFVEAIEGILKDPSPGYFASWGDYDNDGDFDIHLVNNAVGNNKLFRNEGGTAFVNATPASLNPASGRGNASSWVDADNDGDLDLFMTGVTVSNRFFRNDGGGAFASIASGAIAELFRSASWVDIDSDGDMDLYGCRGTSPPTEPAPNRLLRNDGGSANHWLHVDLRGRASNRSAIGARVRIRAGGSVQIRQIHGGQRSQDSLPVEFGLGGTTVVDTLRIFWPSGIVQDTALVAADQIITFTEPPLIVPDVFTTIQGALDVASDGDTVLVRAGTYTGPGNKNLDFGGTDIVLLAQAGPESTMIDCAGIGRGFTLSSGETPAAVVRGFSVVNGAFEGGAANLFHASPTFVNCIFQGHVVSELSAPGRVTLASPQVPERGGALVIEGGAPTFTNCLIVDNTADIAGAIVASDTASATFTRCTIAGNRTLTSSAGILIEDTASLQFIRSIVWGNCEDEATVAATAFVDFDTCVVDSPGVVGPGSESYSTCIFANPRFCAPTVCDGALTPGGDYTLDNGSPALPGVNPWSVLIGTLGQGCTTVVNVWTGAGDATSWEDDDNWSGGMPEDGDDAVIPDVSATTQILYSTAGTTSIDSLYCEERLEVAGDTLAVDGTGDFLERLMVSGGALSGSGTVTAEDTLDFSGGALHGTGTLIANGVTDFSGSGIRAIRGGRVLRIQGGADWTGTGPIRHGDGELGTRIVNAVGSSFSLPGRRFLDHIDVMGGDPAVFENAGTLVKSSVDTAIFEIDVTQSGTLDVDSGVVDYRLDFSNFTGARLAGGTYDLEGVFRFSGAAVETCAATILLDGTESAVNGDVGNALGSLRRNAVQGSITLRNGRSLSTSAAFTNAGIVLVEDASTFTTLGVYTQTTGSSSVKDGLSTIVAAAFSIDGGVVLGSGSFSTGTTFVNSGVIRPGGSPGTLRITADEFQQTLEGALEIELGGCNPGTEFDVIEVTGDVSLHGHLIVELVNEFTPAVMDTFDFLFANSITDTFDTIESFSLDVAVPMTPTVASIAVIGLHSRFQADSGSWLNAANWTNGLPGPTQDVLIDGFVTVDDPGATAREVRIAPHGNLEITTGALQATKIRLQEGTGLGDTLTLSDPAAVLQVQSIDFEPMTSLLWSSGTIVVNGGTWTQDEDTLVVGDSPESSMLYLLNGADAVVPGVIFIGADPGDVGRIEVGPGSTLSLSGLEVGESGTGTLVVRGTVDVVGTSGSAITVGPFGELSGSGTLNGSLLSDGIVAPGDSVGTFTVTGDFTQLSGGTLEIQLQNAGTADRLDVTGQATLGGTLWVRELAGFPLDAEGLEFQVMTYGSNANLFSTIKTSWVVGGGLIVSPDYGSTELVVTIVQRIGAGVEPPRPFQVFQNYPNPFRASTAIQFDLPEPAPVTLRVFDVRGRLVRTLLADTILDAGRSQIAWNGMDEHGNRVAGGIYFFRLRTGSKTEVRRMVLLK